MVSRFHIAEKFRNVGLVLLGLAVLLLKRYYTGPLADIFYAYAGNLAISFSLYFVFLNLRLPLKSRRIPTAAITLLVVELFEVFDGFGILTNTYDPVDLVVNAAGTGLALWMDSAISVFPRGLDSPRS